MKKANPSIGSREFFFIKSHNTGSYYSAGSALARLLTANSNYIGVNSTSPTTENEKIRLLSDNLVHLAFVRGPEASLAYQGDPVYWKAAQPVRALFSFWPAVYSLVAHSSSGIGKISDIRGKSIAINSENSVTGDIMEYLLGLYGINRENTEIYRMGDSIGLNMFILNEVDCVWYDIGYDFENLRTSYNVDSDISNYVPVSLEADNVMREFLKIYPHFYLKDFYYKSYGASVNVLTAPNIAVCSGSMSDETAYMIAKLWWENIDFISRYVPDLFELVNFTDNRKGVPIPFHRGAVKYMSEAGMIPFLSD